MNVSQFKDASTANTNPSSALQRAEHLAALGAKSVLELCVGPSLKVLEKAYSRFGISVTGNDIEQRWKQHYPQGKWLMGDALKLNANSFDAVVFAPPLSKGCSGKRSDALSIEEVTPKYSTFLSRVKCRIITLVLPAKSIATQRDRSQYHKLLSEISMLGLQCEAIPLTAGSRNIVKYVDLYLTNHD